MNHRHRTSIFLMFLFVAGFAVDAMAGTPPPSATITVFKDFTDNNAASVQVTLVCSPGFIQVDQATRPASEGSPAVFKVSNFDGPATCNATENFQPGYDGNTSDCIGIVVDQGDSKACTIVNTPHTARITVFKDFTDDNPASVPVTLSCSNAIIDQATKSASQGSPAVFNLTQVESNNVCSASESVPSGYTANQSDCSSIGSVPQNSFAGVEGNSGGIGKQSHNTTDSCTIINTPQPATFTVNKDFTDGNSASVQVTLTCSDAFIDQATKSASPASPAVFNLSNVAYNNVCSATESVPEFYSGDVSNCTGRSAAPGGSTSCTIVNSPATESFTVFKEYTDENTAQVAVTLTCTDASVDQATGLAAPGSPAVFNLGRIGESNHCTATETVPAGYVADQSRCVRVATGRVGENFCRIINTPESGSSTFTVHKDFSDDNTAEVQVTLTCTDASIDQASMSASEANPAVFNLSDVADGNVCTATETVPEGYTPDESDCVAKAAGPDISGSCQIINTKDSDPIATQFTVRKDFSDESTASVMINLVCSNAGIDQSGKPASEANPAVFNLSDVATGNVCTATETVPDGYTPDESDCAAKAAGPEISASCQIVNTKDSDPVATTFTVRKHFSDDNADAVQILLTCTGAMPDADTKPASEENPAVFNLSDVTEGNMCTATETDVPEGYTPDEEDCADVVAPPSSSTSCQINNEKDDPGPTDPFPDGLDPNQQEIGAVVLDSCLTGTGINEKDFQALCNGLVGSGLTGAPDEAMDKALKEATPDDAAAARSSGMQTNNIQVAAVNGRIGTLRGGGGAGFSASGFNMQYGDVALSGNLLQSFITAFDQNNPAFMQANATQGDDGSVLNEFGRWGAWITGRVIFGEKDPTTNQVAYDFDTAGLTFGLDYRFTDEFVAGLAVGYANTDAKIGVNDGEVETKGYSVSLYGTWFKSDRFYLGGSVGYGSNDYDLIRRVEYKLPGSNEADFLVDVDQTMRADYDGDQYSFALSGGWDFNHNGWTYGPTFRINYVNVDVDAYDEILVGDAKSPSVTIGWAVHIDDQNYESLQPAVGFEFSNAISRSWGVLIPQGYIEVVSELEDGGTLVTGRFLGDLNKQGTFTLLTDDFEETFARAGFGFGLVMKNSKSAFLMVDGDLGRDLLETWYINAGFRWQF